MDTVNTNENYNEWKKIMNQITSESDSLSQEQIDELLLRAQELWEAYKNSDSEMMKSSYLYNNEGISFGYGAHIVNENIEKLFKSNKKALKEYIELIKNDKNLTAQYKLYEDLKKYDKEVDSKEYLKEAINRAYITIDKKFLTESNDKLMKFIEKNKLMINNHVDNETYSLFEGIDALLRCKNNINDYLKIINETAPFLEKINSKQASLKENKCYKSLTIDEFNDKYGTSLNEEEKKLVKRMTNLEESEDKRQYFNELKGECINIVTNLINESKGDNKEELCEIKDTLNEMTYDKSNIIKNFSTLLEIKEILLSDE